MRSRGVLDDGSSKAPIDHSSDSIPYWTVAYATLGMYAGEKAGMVIGIVMPGSSKSCRPKLHIDQPQ